MGERFATAAADMIRRGLPLDVCARKLIAAVCVMGQERLVFGPMQAVLVDVDEKLKALTLEVAEMRDDALEGARVELGTACATQYEWSMREDSVTRAAVEKNGAEFAEFIRERFKGYTQDLEKRKQATITEYTAPSVATAPPVDVGYNDAIGAVPCSACGVLQRFHGPHLGGHEWTAPNL